MKFIPCILSTLLAMPLASCGMDGRHDTSVICQTRPTDDRITIAVVAMIQHRDNATQSIRLMGVTSSCNSGTIFYQQGTDPRILGAQLLGADNGNWFVAGAGGIGGETIQQVP